MALAPCKPPTITDRNATEDDAIIVVAGMPVDSRARPVPIAAGSPSSAQRWPVGRRQ
ncbi:hypothetical protein FRAAL1333 [Frankia alni ACN14a]|uniref:Uncharacterized protein n=1 Tax=Frankia alni (strain DSM 45986 / CECT 9034 / ACN14a) TaxID=326424 RepID=Q0RR30_FRAAA|nr:hypothetical protein FRAAL1333 [Frankia alni ACN14a]